LHGYLADSRSFSYQLSFFGQYFDVYCPDLKGFGTNKGMEYPYSLDDYIEEVEEYKYKNGLKSPNVIAHSFGGRIAIKSAAKDPEAFNKIVLTGAAGLKPRRGLKYYYKKALFNTLKKILPKEKLKRFYSKDYLALDNVMKESFVKIVNEHLDWYLGDIKNPVFIVYGSDDKETPPYMAERLNKKIKDSRLLFIKGAGHFCFIDKPFKFNTEVREFLLS